MVSLSAGELEIQGTQLVYTLYMPSYEVAHLKDPTNDLLGNIAFYMGDKQALLRSGHCWQEIQEGVVKCSATFSLPSEFQVGEPLTVKCTFFQVTVPNHVHLLTAKFNDKIDQVALDLTTRQATLSFSAESRTAQVAKQLGHGITRGLTAVASVVFLLVITLAARSRRELLQLFASLEFSQLLFGLIASRLNWQPSPRFFESTLTLTIAYLATDSLLAPQARRRWPAVLILGAFHGIYYATFTRLFTYELALFLPGVVVGQTLVFLLLVLATGIVDSFSRLYAVRIRKLATGTLASLALGWFFWQLVG